MLHIYDNQEQCCINFKKLKLQERYDRCINEEFTDHKAFKTWIPFRSSHDWSPSYHVEDEELFNHFSDFTQKQ